MSKNIKHGMGGTRLYRIWYHMIDRCENPNSTSYRKYGAKGIKVCEEWHDPTKFFQWAFENGYKEFLTIDRINSQLGYTPKNCRWASYKEQSNNLSSNHIVYIGNERLTISQAADKYGLNYWTLKNRIARGWAPDRAIDQAVQCRSKRNKVEKKLPSVYRKPVRCVETGSVYDSARAAYRETGAHYVGICNCLHGKLQTAGGFHWEYATKEDRQWH